MGNWGTGERDRDRDREREQREWKWGGRRERSANCKAGTGEEGSVLTADKVVRSGGV